MFRLLLGTSGVASMICGQGCTAVDPVGSPRGNQSAAFAEEARILRGQGQLEQAGSRYRQAARQAALGGNTFMAVEYEILAGECFLQTGATSQARVALSHAKGQIEQRPVTDPLRGRAQVRIDTGLGDLDFLARQFGSAEVHYREALPHARGAVRDSLCLRLSLVSQAQGETTLANSYARQIAQPSAPPLAAVRRTFEPLARSGRPPQAIAKAPPTLSGATRRPVRAAPSVAPRSSWNARPTRSNVDRMGRIWRLTVHHTGDEPDSWDRRGIAHHLARVQHHHVQNNGWADIGYHYLIDRRGGVWEGRKITFQGAHAGSPSLNKGNVGIALLGDYSRSRPSVEQQRSLGSLLTYLSRRYRVSARNVYTHSEIKSGSTTCPGPTIQRMVEHYRRGGGLAAASIQTDPLLPSQALSARIASLDLAPCCADEPGALARLE